MSVAHPSSPGLQTGAPFELPPGPPAYEGLCPGLLDLPLHHAQGSPYGTPSDLGGAGVAAAASALGLSAAQLLGAAQQPAQQEQQQPLNALQQLAALQQQQQLAQALASEPLLSLGNLLAAQQGLSVRVQELLLLKQQLAQVVPQRPNSHSGIRGTGPLANPLYKTELCRSWEETGACRYGAKCQFAHGREELRPVVRHPKYKTEVCRTFAQSGTCPYGTRCRFIHTSTTGGAATGAASAGTMSVGGGRSGTATPRAGAFTPPLHSPRDASYTSLNGLASCAPTPGTPPQILGLPAAPSPYASPATAAPAAALNGAAIAAQLLGAPLSPGATALGVHAGAASRYAPASPIPAGFGSGLAAPSAAIAPAGFGFGGGGMAGYGHATGSATGAGDAHGTLAALAALLGGAGSAGAAVVAAPTPLPLSLSLSLPLGGAATNLTTAASALGLVGPPAGLPPVGTAAAATTAAATVATHATGGAASPGLLHLPSCPLTPLGTASTGGVGAMRRSISDSGATTPGGSVKRLPIFEQLIPEADGGSSSTSADRSKTPPAGLASR